MNAKCHSDIKRFANGKSMKFQTSPIKQDILPRHSNPHLTSIHGLDAGHYAFP